MIDGEPNSLSRREFLDILKGWAKIGAGAIVAAITAKCAPTTPIMPPRPFDATSNLPPKLPNRKSEVQISQGDQTFTVTKEDDSLFPIPVKNDYPRPLAIQPGTFSQIIALSEKDLKRPMPTFTLNLQNKELGFNGRNVRTWIIVNDRFTDVKTTIILDPRIFSGPIAAAMIKAKYEGRQSLQGSTLHEVISVISDEQLRQYTIQNLTNALLTAVLTEEIVEANWSYQYVEDHTNTQYNVDFPTPDIKEKITDDYSFPLKKQALAKVLNGQWTPAITASGTALVTQATIADSFRIAKMNEAQIAQQLKAWSTRFQTEGIPAK